MEYVSHENLYEKVIDELESSPDMLDFYAQVMFSSMEDHLVM